MVGRGLGAQRSIGSIACQLTPAGQSGDPHCLPPMSDEDDARRTTTYDHTRTCWHSHDPAVLADRGRQSSGQHYYFTLMWPATPAMMALALDPGEIGRKVRQSPRRRDWEVTCFSLDALLRGAGSGGAPVRRIRIRAPNRMGYVPRRLLRCTRRRRRHPRVRSAGELAANPSGIRRGCWLLKRPEPGAGHRTRAAGMLCFRPRTRDSQRYHNPVWIELFSDRIAIYRRIRGSKNEARLEMSRWIEHADARRRCRLATIGSVTPNASPRDFDPDTSAARSEQRHRGTDPRPSIATFMAGFRRRRALSAPHRMGYAGATWSTFGISCETRSITERGRA